MAANYKQSVLSGEKWTRCNTVSIVNPYGRTPSISFTEEDVINVGGEEPIFRMAGALTSAFDPAKVISLVNPETGDPMGETTYGAMYVAIYSAYLAEAQARDAAQSVTP